MHVSLFGSDDRPHRFDVSEYFVNDSKITIMRPTIFNFILRTIPHLDSRNRAPSSLDDEKVSHADLKTTALSAIPVEHLTAEVLLLPSMLSADNRFPINGIIFNLSQYHDLIILFISGYWPALIC